MIDQQLRREILMNLEKTKYGLTEESLKAAITISTGNINLTTSDFRKEVERLEEDGLIRSWENLNHETVFGIEELGKKALKGL